MSPDTYLTLIFFSLIKDTNKKLGFKQRLADNSRELSSSDICLITFKFQQSPVRFIHRLSQEHQLLTKKQKITFS